jgi:uncharacterized membrane protein YfcA
MLTGVATGVVGAILGTGGGVFLIPVLVIVFHVPMHYAIATSIVSVIATSSAVASANVERGTANMKLGMTLEIATSTGAILGGLTAAYLSATVLEAMFAVVLLPTAWFMWRGREDQGHDATSAIDATHASARQPGPLDAEFFDESLGRTVSYHVIRLWAGLLVSFFAGNLSGLLGIGGGVFKVPAINLLCRVPIKAAAATSNFMIGVTAAASAFVYFGRGQVRPVLAAAVVLGTLIGSMVGNQFSHRVSANIVRQMFSLLLVAVAVYMAIRAGSG